MSEITDAELAKMDSARFMLEPPAPDVVGSLIAALRQAKGHVNGLECQIHEWEGLTGLKRVSANRFAVVDADGDWDNDAEIDCSDVCLMDLLAKSEDALRQAREEAGMPWKTLHGQAIVDMMKVQDALAAKNAALGEIECVSLTMCTASPEDIVRKISMIAAANHTQED